MHTPEHRMGRPHGTFRFCLERGCSAVADLSERVVRPPTFTANVPESRDHPITRQLLGSRYALRSVNGRLECSTSLDDDIDALSAELSSLAVAHGISVAGLRRTLTFTLAGDQIPNLLAKLL